MGSSFEHLNMLKLIDFKLYTFYHGRIQRGGGRASRPRPPEKSQNIGFLSNTGPDPLKKTMPAFNVVLSLARQRADGGPLLVLFGSSLPLYL